MEPKAASKDKIFNAKKADSKDKIFNAKEAARQQNIREFNRLMNHA